MKSGERKQRNIKEFFGNKSPQHTYIEGFSFSMDNSVYFVLDLPNKTPVLDNFLTTCIEAINNVGVYKPPNKNFLQGMSDTALWTIISIGIPGLLTVGGLFGKYFSDTQNIELRRENAELKKDTASLRSRTTFPNAYPVPNADTNEHVDKKINSHSRK